MAKAMKKLDKEDKTAVDLVEGIEWPFLISGLWCVLGGAGYLYLALTPLRMPVHKKQEEQEMGKYVDFKRRLSNFGICKSNNT